MLKIKDSVDLKELEKFGFKPIYNKDTGKIEEYYRIRGDKKGTTINFDDNFNGKHKYRNFWTIFTWNKRISNHGYIKLTDDDYEILYDLIQARISRESRVIKMRNIKFRGKYLDDTSEWLYGNYVYIEDDVFQHKIADKSGLLLDIDIETLGQYTGLHDRNRKRNF